MGSPVIQALSGFLAAAIGWLTLEFLGRPLRKFFDLRGETVELLTRIANVRAAYAEFHDEISEGVTFPRRENSGTELNEKELEALTSARKELRALASKFRAFALNETLASKAVGLLGYDAFSAGQSLIGLSNTIDTYGKLRSDQKNAVSTALKFKPFEP
jgi:hypothetical protein